MEMCRHLRWKGFYGKRWATVAELAEELATSDSPFSCLRTCQSWGPDDDVAAPEACNASRSCFEPSNRVPKRAE